MLSEVRRAEAGQAFRTDVRNLLVCAWLPPLGPRSLVPSGAGRNHRVSKNSAEIDRRGLVHDPADEECSTAATVYVDALERL